MIDSIEIALDIETAPKEFDRFMDTLNNPSTIIDVLGVRKTGSYKNLKITKSHSKITVYGSLAKYYLGTNQKTLRPTDIAPAFNKLSIDLGLPIHQAKVKRVDLAENLITRQAIDRYKPFLGEIKYLKRLENDNNVEYRSKYRALNIYNKVKDVQRRRLEQLLEILKRVQVTRVELKILKHDRLAQLLGLTTVTVNDVILCYPDLVDIWWNVWASMKKNKDILDFDLSVFSTKGLIDKQIMIKGIEAMGGLTAVTGLIKAARKVKGLFANKDQPGYLIDKYTRIMSAPKLTAPSKLIEELELKMKIAYFVNTPRPVFNIHDSVNDAL